MNGMLIAMQMKLHNFFVQEDGEVNIVAMTILIAIAVVLAVFFRKEIVNIVNDLFESIRNGVNNISDPVTR